VQIQHKILYYDIIVTRGGIMAKNKMNYLILIIYATAMISITLIQIIVISFFPSILENVDSYTLFSSITNLLLYVSLFILFFLIFKDYLKKQFINFKANKNHFFLLILIGFVVMMLASFGSSIILEFLGITETSANQESLNMLLEGTLFDKISLFIFAVLLVPLIEELVFRKAILELFYIKVRETDNLKVIKVKKIISAIFAIIVSSLIFGFIHIMSFETEQLLQIIYYAGLGAVLGTAYLASNKNILVPILMHFSLNLMVTAIQLLGM